MPKLSLVGRLDALRARLNELQPEVARVSTGALQLDAHLGGGMPRGAVTEIFGETGCGAWWLGLRTLAQITNAPCAIVEPAGSFFPPGAAWLGVNLRNLLIVREPNRKRALWALDRIAREKSVAATLAAIPKLGDTELRRLQLAAEASGQALILLRSPAELSRASWGALRLRVRATPGDDTRQVVVEVLRLRGAMPPRPMLLEIENDAMAVRTSALLPHRADHAGVASAG
jgi:protein ImuA